MGFLQISPRCTRRLYCRLHHDAFVFLLPGKDVGKWKQIRWFNFWIARPRNGNDQKVSFTQGCFQKQEKTWKKAHEKMQAKIKSKKKGF